MDLKNVNIGGCAQHTIHGGFQTGTSNAGWDIDEILKAVFLIQHDSRARREVYTQKGKTMSYS